MLPLFDPSASTHAIQLLRTTRHIECRRRAFAGSNFRLAEHTIRTNKLRTKLGRLVFAPHNFNAHPLMLGLPSEASISQPGVRPSES